MKQERAIDLDGEQYRMLKRIIETHVPDKEVWAYGSRVKWKASVGADLDLVVFDCDFFTVAAFREALEESDLVISVDVMNWEKIPDDFKDNINKQYIVMQKKRSLLKGWREIKLGDFITLQRGHDLSKAEMQGGKFPVAGSNGIIGYHNVATTKGIGVTIGRSGNVGNAYLYKTDFWAHNTSLYIKNFNGNDAIFAYYFLKNIKLSNLNSGSAVPTLNRNYVHAVKIILPPLVEQKAIAEVLSSLDDKINLLHRQNKVLEITARTFYRKWIINNSNFANWEKIPLGEILQISIGRTPPRKEFHWFSKNPKDIKWISVRDMGIEGAYIFNTSEYLTNDAIEEFNIPIIPSNTVVLSFKMTVGRVKITTEDMLSNEAIAQFKFKSNVFFNEKYLYLHLKDFNFNAFGSTSSIAAAINCAIIRDIKIPVPEKQIIDKFEKTIRPIFDKIYANQSQIRMLKNLRDAILPKIMNGQTRIKEFVSQNKNEV